MKAVAYFRVSTAGQGRSGLGLEAQRSAVQELACSRGFDILSSFIEIESGRRGDRPELQAALRLAKLTGAVLVIAKLDRLSRNAAFLLTLRDSGVRFLAADIPDATDLTIGVLAVIAQAEREAISRRTKEALSAVKARISNDGAHLSERTGRVVRRLGNPHGAAAFRRAGLGNCPAVAGVIASADARAADLRPLIVRMQGEGLSLSQIARELDHQGILTARGKRWHPSTVSNVLARVNAARRPRPNK